MLGNSDTWTQKIVRILNHPAVVIIIVCAAFVVGVIIAFGHLVEPLAQVLYG